MRAAWPILLLILAWPAAGAPAAAPPDPYPDVASAYWVEVDGLPVWAGQPERRLPMASLAKLMTALLIAEGGDLDAVVTVSAAAAAETGARLGLRRGERVRAGDLLTAALVRSANDACRALADWRPGGQASFVLRMNQRARQMQLVNTHFADACGHDAATQYSSARDLARLARSAMRQAPIAAAVAKRKFAFKSLDGTAHSMRATNALLAGLPGTRGIKTGYTPGAGRCIVALVERDGVEVLAVLLHAPDRWWDSAGLIELAFKRAGATRSQPAVAR
ncbi:MAG: serine hydrolase [Arenimonas sp.]|jgi:D-alanyl-D-alanine carboxypeptidase (penicillin-binding protein 5/6)